ncbi:MAG TPA: hypothetical protein VH328_01210 [Burkholderiaceae bacterium]|nr:hypothetical protein [Burkholderiaceae bacterium]
MTIQSLNSSNSAYTTAVTATAQSTSQATQNTQATQDTDGTWVKKHGDGSVIASLKAFLTAQGFSQANSGMSKKDYDTAMHNFVHAAFAAAHAQAQTDHSESQGNTTHTAEAFAELGSQAQDGSVPPDLQAAFAALQQTQTSGSGMTASLAQVLQGMSQSQAQNQDATNITTGSLVDVAA